MIGPGSDKNGDESQENIIMDPQEINIVMSEGPQSYKPHAPRTDSIESRYWLYIINDAI